MYICTQIWQMIVLFSLHTFDHSSLSQGCAITVHSSIQNKNALARFTNTQVKDRENTYDQGTSKSSGDPSYYYKTYFCFLIRLSFILWQSCSMLPSNPHTQCNPVSQSQKNPVFRLSEIMCVQKVQHTIQMVGSNQS